MRIGILALISCAFVLVCGLPQSVAQSTKNKVSEYCEDGGAESYPLDANFLPKAVVDSVMNAPDSKEMLEGEKPSDVTPGKLLHAAKIHLSSDGETEFMILSSPPLSGADNSWFWIVRKHGTNASILLEAGGNCVELETTRTRGYRDVMSYWAGGGTEVIDTFQYDGKVYKLVHKQTRPWAPTANAG